MHNLVGINFKIDGQNYAYRSWPSVPRAGDVVNLHDPTREKDFRYPARVLLVVWGVREESVFGKQLECDVHIAWDDNITYRLQY
jgi:hypothetical protein